MDKRFECFEGRRYRRKVRAIVVDTDDRALLIQPHGYDADAWTLVGGGVEAHETDAQAMRRELAEETGLQAIVALEQASHRHRFLFSDKVRLQRGLDHDGQSAALFFVRVPAGSKLRLQAEEVRAGRWVGLVEAEACLKVEAQRELFRRVLAEFALVRPSAAGLAPTAIA